MQANEFTPTVLEKISTTSPEKNAHVNNHPVLRFNGKTYYHIYEYKHHRDIEEHYVVAYKHLYKYKAYENQYVLNDNLPMSVFFKNVVIRQRINFRLMDIFNHTNCAQRFKIRHKPHFECEKTVVLTSDSVKDCSDGNAFWECRGISARDYCVAYLIFDMSRNFFYVCDRCIFTFPVQRPYERCVFKFYREVLGFVKQKRLPPRHVGTGNVHDTYNSILVNDSHSSFNTVKTASVDSEEIFGQPRIVVYYGCGNIIVAVFGGEGCQCVCTAPYIVQAGFSDSEPHSAIAHYLPETFVD